MKRLSSYVSLGFALAVVAAFSGACTTHGEGGRCDPTNKNASGGFADCDSNLNCTSGNALELPDGGGHPAGSVCCPFDLSTSTVDICRGSPPSPGSDASIPDGGFESGTFDAAQDQSTSDVASDAPAESSSDAASDATGD